MNVRVARSLAVVVAAVLVASAALTGCQKVTGDRYVKQLFGWEQVATDETYRTALDFDLNQNIELKLDVYQPVGDTLAQRPVQLWMHGGAWTKGYGTRADIRGYAQDAARRGYVGVNISYRLRNQAVLPGAALDAYDDAVAAVAWVKANAARFRVDPNAIIAAGYSAGSINAMNLVYPPFERSPAGPSPVIGAMGIAGQNSGLPIADRPPVILFSAVDDGIVAYNGLKARCDADAAAGNICTLVTYPGGGHGIAGSQMTDIQTKMAQFAMDTLLPRAGYYKG